MDYEYISNPEMIKGGWVVSKDLFCGPSNYYEDTEINHVYFLI